MAIPKAMQAKYNEIEPIITAFCAEFLNEDYRQLCFKMLEKLCRKRPSPLLSGNARSWAAGIVYFVCAENHYFQRAPLSGEARRPPKSLPLRGRWREAPDEAFLFVHPQIAV